MTDDIAKTDPQELVTLFPWQTSDYQNLESLKSRLPQALLLHGNNGIGKTNLAQVFINSLLCETANSKFACDTCPSCLLLKAESHPDLLVLDADYDDTKKNKNITVAQIRKTQDFISLSPHRGKHKVVFIPNSGYLTHSSGNALLKILEEPPATCIFILINPNISSVIPTIRSRCHKIHISRPTRLLSTNPEGGIPDKTRQFWLDYYDQSPLIAPEINESQLDLLMQTIFKPSIDNIYQLSSEIDSKKISFAFFLEFMTKWLTDLIQLKLAAQPNYFKEYLNSENINTIETIINKLNLEHAFYYSDKLSEITPFGRHPLNHKLQAEALLFNNQQLFTRISN